MGCFQAVQPMLGKEGVGPAMMIAPPATSLLAQAFPEDASQPHPNPPVQGAERVAMAVLEVLKPAPQRGVRSLMIFVRLSPEVRFVFARIVSLSFCRLFGRGKRRPRSNR